MSHISKEISSRILVHNILLDGLPVLDISVSSIHTPFCSVFKRGRQKVSIYKGCLSCDVMLKNGLFLSQSLGLFIINKCFFQNS